MCSFALNLPEEDKDITKERINYRNGDTFNNFNFVSEMVNFGVRIRNEDT